MPGPFREYDGTVDRDRVRGIDTTGRTLAASVRAANDVLREAGPILGRAREQLLIKTDAGTSRNIFLVMHLFDHLVAECFKPVVGPYLEPLSGAEDVNTVWVLWPLERLTVWSSERHEWINLLLDAGDAEEEPDSDEMGPIQEAEQYFLSRIGHTGGSPYLFRISSP